MRCPSCSLELEETERGGTQAAYCPFCDIVWLGEDEFEINPPASKYLDAEWNPDSLEAEPARPGDDR